MYTIKFLNGRKPVELSSLSGADLRGADLSWANLRGADLSGADLSGANLRGANLIGTDLRGANLSGADLSGADLSGANLNRANLRGVDLSWADLNGANLSWANLRGADLSETNLSGADLRWANLNEIPEIILSRLSIVPESGSFVGWKKLKNGTIAKVFIPEYAKRCNATGRKCRASEVIVLEMFGHTVDYSSWNNFVEYSVGKTIVPDSWDPDRWQECSHGIHFFITRVEAEAY